MIIINFSFPFEKIYLSIFNNLMFDKKFIARLSKKYQPETLIFSVPNQVEPCSLALIYSYVIEDSTALNHKVSNLSLRALTYLTRSKQLYEAINKSQNYNNLAIIATNKETIIKIAKEINYNIDNVVEESYICNDLNEMNQITTFRLNSLNL
ncbi:hypothetical protein [Caldisphaera sp.]|uniref:hypothetical protein n=1 Tax=Caldisphaera sp. TaxID=2060322 RepID=UPI0025C11666|nr:hypothetical protein [Caldisphaera sp.]